MQQEKDIVQTLKERFNIAFFLMLVWQRAIIVPLRNRFGREAQGLPCVFALGLMFLWASFSKDPWMWWYLAFWVFFQFKNRIQSIKHGAEIHSLYDGYPVLAGWIERNEHRAKLVWEPILVAWAGFFAKWHYENEGWHPNGLPFFLIGGALACAFVEHTKQTMWKRRIQQQNDARIENESMVNEYRQRWGNW
jgi:hypothetical protein